MYPNLFAEIARNGLHRKEIAKTLETSIQNLGFKLNGKVDFSLTEVMKVRDTFFPTMTIDYLFKKSA